MRGEEGNWISTGLISYRLHSCKSFQASLSRKCSGTSLVQASSMATRGRWRWSTRRVRSGSGGGLSSSRRVSDMT